MKRGIRILRDMGALLLASALAFMPIAAVHSLAGAHPLGTSLPKTGTGLPVEIGANAKAEQEAPNADDAGEAVPADDDADLDEGAFPSSYYLTNADLVTSVKLQNPWGACWAFAIASAVESSILHAQAAADGTLEEKQAEAADGGPKLSELSDDVDVSERAIAWLAHELQTDESAGDQAGEGLYRVNKNDHTTQLAGGNFPIVEAALAARQSLVSEEAAPYQYNGYAAGTTPWYSTQQMGLDARTFDWSIDDNLRTNNDLGWYVSGIIELPSPSVAEYDAGSGGYHYVGYDAAATRDIKETVMNVGAVAIALTAESALPGEKRRSDHFDYGTWSQYDASPDIFTNHAVTIVGWDDSYGRDNFSGSASEQPPADGAWLCKNNWGSDTLYSELGDLDNATRWGVSDKNGASGFFWLSYYDHTITSPIAFEVTPEDEAADLLYQYDYLGMSEYSEPASYEGTILVANSFIAEETELMRAVTAQTFREDESVDCRVYLLPPESNSGWLATEQSAEFAHAGFHTIQLDSPVLVAKGQRFIVVQRVHANIEADGRSLDASYLNLELAFNSAPGGNVPVETMATVTANPDETYVAFNDDDDQWMSLESFNEWYQDLRTETGAADATYGNALIKVLSDNTSMSSDEHIYELRKI